MLLKAIQIQPNYADAHNNFGNVLKELGEYKDAINKVEKAIQIQPNLASAHYNHGVVLEKLGEYKDAINSLLMKKQSKFNLILRLPTIIMEWC